MATRTTYDQFKAAAPGERFQKLRECRTAQCESCRLAMIAGGVLICATGVVLLVLPGPGILLIIVGLTLIAQESQTVARALDGLEVAARKSWKNVRRCFTTH